MEKAEQQITLEKEIEIWKENQARHPHDGAFFHYTQRIIDDLESQLDFLSRSEGMENEYL